MNLKSIKKKSLTLLLLSATVISSIYAFKKKKEFSSLNSKLEETITAKENIQKELEKVNNDYQKLYNKNKKLSRRVISEINKIITLKDSVNNLDSDLKKDQEELNKKTFLTKNLTSKINDLASEISKAKSLKASKIAVLTMKKKNNGKFTKTTNNSKIDAFKIDFQIQKNEVADAGKKVIRIQVLDPLNKIVLNKTNKTKSSYSDQVTIDYQNEGLDVVSLIELNRSEIKKGKYKVNAFVDGHKISNTFFSIK